MTIKSLKELEQAMKLCVKHGVRSLKIGTVELLVDAPVTAEVAATATTEAATPPTYTNDDYLLWSAGNEPGV